MKHSQLLVAVKEKLRAEMTNVRSVQILPHEGKVSLTAGLPVIGILDSGEKPPYPGKMQEQVKYQVFVVAYQQILSGDPGAAVVGTGEKPGVMNLVEMAIEILVRERFDFDYVESLGTSPVMPFLKKDHYEISFKVARLEYRKLRSIT